MYSDYIILISKEIWDCLEWHRFDPDIRNNVLLLILISLCPIHKMKFHLRLSFKQFLHEWPEFTADVTSMPKSKM